MGLCPIKKGSYKDFWGGKIVQRHAWIFLLKYIPNKLHKVKIFGCIQNILYRVN
ncbi:hypothetical protein P615_17325 [Brevibacillus laterosporus PE36]|nr:hypothetical protein P615_17325 [Brevibacillus laterosporus PE36]